MADEHHVVQLLGLDVRDDIGDPRAQIKGGVGEVRAVPRAGEVQRVDVVAGPRQRGRDARPGPGAETRPRNKNDRGHQGILSPV